MLKALIPQLTLLIILASGCKKENSFDCSSSYHEWEKINFEVIGPSSCFHWELGQLWIIKRIGKLSPLNARDTLFSTTSLPETFKYAGLKFQGLIIPGMSADITVTCSRNFPAPQQIDIEAPTLIY
jgi:hypothetical protein